MRDFLDQVERASEAHLYYVAFAGALMCGAMESADGRATKGRYIDWFDQHVAPSYGGFVTGEDCYGLRCAMLHQARFEPHMGSYKRILFIEPGATSAVVHNNVMNDALNIDVERFVGDMLAGARSWLKTAEATPEYQANQGKMMQRYPDGLPPYIVGVPVIS
jgi:hypothetical protein